MFNGHIRGGGICGSGIQEGREKIVYFVAGSFFLIYFEISWKVFLFSSENKHSSNCIGVIVASKLLRQGIKLMMTIWINLHNDRNSSLIRFIAVKI